MAAAFHSKALAHKAWVAWRSVAAATVAAAAQQSRQRLRQAADHAADENSPTVAAAPLQPANSYVPAALARTAVPRVFAPPAAHSLHSPKPSSPGRPQLAGRQQQRQRQPAPSHTTTVVVMHRSGAPANALAQRCTGQRAQHALVPPIASGSEGKAEGLGGRVVQESVAAWRGTADYWRERLRGGPDSPGAGMADAGSTGVRRS